MLVAIHQLHYLPWLRYFEKISRSDVFVVLDDVQFTKNGWQNRNKVKASSGTVRLTVPVHATSGVTLDQIRIDNGTNWPRKHLRTLEFAYRKAHHFAAYAAFLENTYSMAWESLSALNRHMLEFFVQSLGIDTRIVYSSDLDVSGEATERLVNLIQAVGGDTYYTGTFAVGEYLDTGAMKDAGIAMKLQQWRCPMYPQLHYDFIPDLSIVDLLMNCGPRSLALLSGKGA